MIAGLSPSLTQRTLEGATEGPAWSDPVSPTRLMMTSEIIVIIIIAIIVIAIVVITDVMDIIIIVIITLMSICSTPLRKSSGVPDSPCSVASDGSGSWIGIPRVRCS